MNSNLEKINDTSSVKVVISNAIPAMLGMLMVLIYNMADLFFIGQTGDALEVAAVSIATPIFLIFMSLGNIFGIGGASFLSRSLGCGNKTLTKKISSFCFWSCVVIGIILSITIFLSMDGIVRLLGASSDISGMVSSYIRILCISGPCILLSSCYSNLVRAEGNAKKSMLGMMIGNFVNIILDPIFILVLGLGVPGAAIATVIGNICGTTYYIILILRKQTSLTIKIKDYSIKNGILKNILIIGIPASTSTILMSVSNIIVNGQMSIYGDLAVAGIGVAIKVTMITSMLCVGIGMGVQPLLGYCIGSQNEKKYKEIFKVALIFALIVSGVLTIMCYLGLNQIVGAFVTDVDAFDYAHTFSMILLSTSFLFGLLHVLINALQASGAGTASLIVNLSRQGIIYIPMVFILGATVGIYGLVLAQPIADILSFILAIILYKIVHKNMFKVI